MPPVSTVTLDSPSGAFQARIFMETGRIALAGPDLTGTPLANVVTLEPIEVKIGIKTVQIGAVIGAPRTTANSVEVDQDLDGGQATARLTFPARTVGTSGSSARPAAASGR